MSFHGSLQERQAVYEKVLLEALEDGVLTQAEIDELDGLRRQLKLKDEEVRSIRVRAFQRAIEAVKADGLFSPKEEKDLEKIAQYLGLDDTHLAHNRTTLAKMRVLYEIHKGNLPIDQVAGISLELGEMVHLSVPASFFPIHASSRLAKAGAGPFFSAGSPYRMGHGRLYPLAEDELGEAFSGMLTISNQRVMFNSGQHAFRLKYDKLLGVTVFSDGFLLAVDTGEPRVIQPANRKELEVLLAIISRYLNPPPKVEKPAPGKLPAKGPGKPPPPRR
ncbi:MAG: hypothetical protein VKP62_03835 [Candidatus Sericytochromatia bacterium]|nr:hypothetical protein [Candidatus Sericytochromatia bacterium]